MIHAEYSEKIALINFSLELSKLSHVLGKACGYIVNLLIPIIIFISDSQGTRFGTELQ